jgi:hypothetical protein
MHRGQVDVNCRSDSRRVLHSFLRIPESYPLKLGNRRRVPSSKIRSGLRVVKNARKLEDGEETVGLVDLGWCGRMCLESFWGTCASGRSLIVTYPVSHKKLRREDTHHFYGHPGPTS